MTLTKLRFDKIVGPKGAWLLGDATRMEDYRAYKEWADEYGPKHPVAVLFASESLLVMSNAEDARYLNLFSDLPQNPYGEATIQNMPKTYWAGAEREAATLY